ncbi:hypothetical protein PSPO01_11477 [Paraphaeosphaeria sporulosa]
MTPDCGEPESNTARPLDTDSDIEHSARPSMPPTSLKFKLRNTWTDPTADPIAPPRSGRAVIMTDEHRQNSIGSGALLPESKPRKRFLLLKLRASRQVGTPPPPHEFERRVAGHVGGSLPSDVGGSIVTEKRGGFSLQIKPGNINDPIDVESLPSPLSYLLVNQSANYYAPFPLQYMPPRPNVPPTLFAPTGADKQFGKASSHQSHDICRSYIDLKDAPAPSSLAISCAKLSAEVSAGMPPSGGSTSFPHMHSANVTGHGNSHADTVGQPS